MPPEIPEYRCHKKVRAFKIGKIEGCTLFSLDGVHSVKVSGQFIATHPLNLTGYYVLYADGYESYSPAKAFEEGYTKI